MVCQSTSGYTNLCTHIQINHAELIAQRASAAASVAPTLLMESMKYPARTRAAFAWLECIVLSLLPFSFCEQNVVRRHFRHSSISVDTLMTYLSQLTTLVEEKIKEKLPSRFAVIFDGWTGGDTHYVSVFASFPAVNACGYESVLLALAPMGEEDSHTADEHYSFLKFVLSVYGKTIENVVALVGDNENTNRAFGRRVGPTFVGCHSHRFNLAVRDVLADHKALIGKVHDLMRRISFQIPSAKLRRLTPLKPKMGNETRWSSTYEMLERYIRLKSYIPQIGVDEVEELMLSEDEDDDLLRLLRQLKDLDSVTKALQDARHGLYDARLLFEGVMDKHPSTRSRLGTRSNLVDNPIFENAVAKVQAANEAALTSSERKSIAHLLRDEQSRPQEDTGSEGFSFAERLLKRRRLNESQQKSRYLDLRFILATSNLCERLFSLAGHAIGSRRKGSLPSNIESQLFLNVNSGYWGISEVHEMLHNKR